MIKKSHHVQYAKQIAENILNVFENRTADKATITCFPRIGASGQLLLRSAWPGLCGLLRAEGAWPTGACPVPPSRCHVTSPASCSAHQSGSCHRHPVAPNKIIIPLFICDVCRAPISVSQRSCVKTNWLISSCLYGSTLRF